MKKQFLLSLVFILSLLSFYLLNHYTDLAIDDFPFKNINTDNPDKVGQRVSSLLDLFESQYNHYFLSNGRVLANGLAQVFLMTENKTWFNIANMFMFGMMQLLVFLMIGIKRKEITITFYILTLTILWFLLPGPNHTLLWLTGSLNYLWAVVIVLAFLYFHNKMLQSKNPVSFLWYPIFFLSGFLAAATHEVISIGVSGALFFYYLFSLNKFRGVIIPMVIGFFLGTIFIVLAPGNMVRTKTGGVEEATILLMILRRIWGFISSAPSMIAVIFLLIVMAILFVSNRKGLIEIMKRNIILLLSILFSLGFILVAGAYQPRVFFGVSVFSIIVLLSIIWKYRPIFNWKWSVVLTYILAIIMVVEFVFVVRTLHENKTIFDSDERTWVNSTDKVFEFRDKKLNRFVSTGLGEYDCNFWSNIVMSWYYGKKYMIFLPSDLYHHLFLSNKLIDENNLIKITSSVTDSLNFSLYRSPISNFLIIPLISTLSKQIEKGAYVRFESIESIPVKNLDIRQQAAKFIYSSTPPPIKNEKVPCYILETKHGNFLYFKAPESIPMDKVKSLYIFGNENQTQALFNLY